MTSHSVAPEVWPYFEAGKKGNWSKADKLYRNMARRSHHFDFGVEPDERLVATWQPVNETYWVLRELASADPGSYLRYAGDILDSLSAGSIYLGQTDAGRFMVTFLSNSHADGDPFLVLTPNALADGSYLDYLRRMYGAKMNVPTPEGSQAAFADYLEDAKRRHEMGQLKPGELVTITNGLTAVSGQVAVMEINGRILKLILNRNPQREIFLEGPYLPDWSFPHLMPEGVLLRVVHDPLNELPREVMARNREWWSNRTSELLGERVSLDTPWTRIIELARATYLDRKKRGLEQYARWRVGNTTLPLQAEVCVNYAIQRAGIGQVYSWRARVAAEQSVKAAYTQEADLAFRQAFALCPNAYDTVYYQSAKWLGEQQHWDDLRLVLDFLELMALPEEASTREWIERSRAWLKQSAAGEPLPAQVPQAARNPPRGDDATRRGAATSVGHAPPDESGAPIKSPDSDAPHSRA